MFHLTSHYRTHPCMQSMQSLQKEHTTPIPLLSNSKSFYGNSFAYIKSNKDGCLYNLKDKPQETLQEPSKAKCTPPLVLFINLLMKHGKKTHALRVLSMTLSLFKARISKIKMEKHVSCLKKKHFKHLFNKEGYYKNTFLLFSSKRTIANYSIKASNLFVHFSKSGTNSKGSELLLKLFAWSLNYKKLFPFIFHFERVFGNFYAKKRFFCGKFLDLKQYPQIKKRNPLFSKTGVVFSKKKNNSNNLFLALLNISNDSALQSMLPVKASYVFRKQNKKKEIFVDPCKHSKQENPTLASFQSNSSLSCLWYKTGAKKPSWDKLTTPQKNTFLFCLYKAISNVKPPLECRTKKIGGSNKQIPSQVSERRQWGIAIRWIIEVAQKEFSKKISASKIIAYKGKDVYKPNNHFILNNISKVSGNTQDQLFPRGMQRQHALFTKNTVQKEKSGLVSWALDEKTKFLSSLLQKKTKGLRVRSKKTRFYSFCFFLAESLENAYYKTGPAMQKRNLWVDTALANRAFLRYRWW